MTTSLLVLVTIVYISTHEVSWMSTPRILVALLMGIAVITSIIAFFTSPDWGALSAIPAALAALILVWLDGSQKNK